MTTYLKTAEEMMFPALHAETKEQVFRKICDRAVSMGYVEEGFYDDLVVREQSFPTGLATSIPIAIAHVGTHCLESFIAIAALENPVEFENMDGSEEKLQVKIVFVFGLIHQEEQSSVLRRLSVLFQSAGFLEEIYGSQSAGVLLKTMRSYLGDMLWVYA
jgi:PTS system galactitol-specific IIA component